MQTTFKKANQLAKSVFHRFMKEVIEQHVLADRTVKLTDNDKEALTKDKIVDIRPINLMSISGKGGFHSDPEKFARYSKNFNITLLDHLLSVGRGAILLAALDWLTQDPEMDEDHVKERLMVLVAIAFLHDLDKMLKLPRDEPLGLQHVEFALTHYGITEFLGDITLTPEQIRFLIEHVEPSQQHRHPCANEPKRIYKLDAKRYIQLADKLDGLWCQHGSKAGLDAIIQRLKDDFSVESDILAHWQPIDIYDPHHPFLLDELQHELSIACTRKAGIPPLLETHQDGRLFMLLPKQYAEVIQEAGLRRLLNKVLPFNLELIISNRAIPELRNGKPNYDDLVDFLTELDTRQLGQLFKVSNSLIDTLTQLMSESFANIGLEPRWQTKLVGQTSSPYHNPDELEPFAQSALLKAAIITLLLNLKLPVTKKNGLPSYEEREQQLLSRIAYIPPEWLSNLEDDHARRVLLGVWCVSLAQTYPEVKEHIWGVNGLLKQWLEGTEEKAGFRQFFVGEGIDVIASVEQHFSQLLNQKRVAPQDENVAGRCLFTDAPAQALISSSLKLYEVKVSAFTGREGKPDSITAPSKGVVPISFVSLAEHKLRQDAFDIQKGKPSGVPTLVSSPITTGLFGALILTGEKQPLLALSSYDINRKKKEKVNFRGLELYRHRYRIARLERIPERIEDQINTLRLLLQTCLRIGRPLHLFRGLPTPQRAFFYFDAMPRVLQQIIGKRELRLEEIPAAIHHLDIAQQITEIAGLGYDTMLLYAMPQTRFAACALVWCYAQDHSDDAKKAKSLKHLQHQMIQSQQEIFMNEDLNEQDGTLVLLGQAAIAIQKYPSKGSRSEELLVFSLCFDFLKRAVAGKQTDQNSLIYGLADTLSYNLLRKGKTSEYFKRRTDLLDEACLKFAEQFVHNVWQQVLQQKLPAQKQYQLLSSIYRMAFIQAHRQKALANKAEA